MRSGESVGGDEGEDAPSTPLRQALATAGKMPALQRGRASVCVG